MVHAPAGPLLMYYFITATCHCLVKPQLFLVVGNFQLFIYPQAMTTHRPYLTMASFFSLFGVAAFYTFLCLRRQFSSSSSSSQVSNRVRRAARSRARRQLQQTRDGDSGNGSQPNGSIVRRRRRGEEKEEAEEDTGQESQGSCEDEQHRHSS